jgi:hypothetical protein
MMNHQLWGQGGLAPGTHWIGSVVGWGTMLQAVRSRVRFSMRPLDFSIDTILPTDIWPSSRLRLLNRNECQESSWGWRAPYRYLWVNCFENVEASMSHNDTGLHSLLQGPGPDWALWRGGTLSCPRRQRFQNISVSLTNANHCSAVRESMFSQGLCPHIQSTRMNYKPFAL